MATVDLAGHNVFTPAYEETMLEDGAHYLLHSLYLYAGPMGYATMAAATQTSSNIYYYSQISSSSTTWSKVGRAEQVADASNMNVITLHKTGDNWKIENGDGTFLKFDYTLNGLTSVATIDEATPLNFEYITEFEGNTLANNLYPYISSGAYGSVVITSAEEGYTSYRIVSEQRLVANRYTYAYFLASSDTNDYDELAFFKQYTQDLKDSYTLQEVCNENAELGSYFLTNTLSLQDNLTVMHAHWSGTTLYLYARDNGNKSVYATQPQEGAIDIMAQEPFCNYAHGDQSNWVMIQVPRAYQGNLLDGDELVQGVEGVTRPFALNKVKGTLSENGFVSSMYSPDIFNNMYIVANEALEKVSMDETPVWNTYFGPAMNRARNWQANDGTPIYYASPKQGEVCEIKYVRYDGNNVFTAVPSETATINGEDVNPYDMTAQFNVNTGMFGSKIFTTGTIYDLTGYVAYGCYAQGLAEPAPRHKAPTMIPYNTWNYFTVYPFEFEESDLSASVTTGVTTVKSSSDATEVARYNMMGQKVDAAQGGLQIIKMSDGTTRKVMAK